MYDWTASIRRINDYYDKENGSVTMGCDGYVDDVWQVVDKRVSSEEFKEFEKVGDFARAILARGAGGITFELVRKRRSYGGFTCNTGKACGRLGGGLTLVGMFGVEAVDPVFREFQDKYNVISIGSPSVTSIFEFPDGKIMFGGTSPEPPTPRTWDNLVNAMGMDGLKAAFGGADVIGFGYYGNKEAFEDIVRHLIRTVLTNGRCKRMFFDFANIENRPKTELTNTFAALAPLNGQMPMTLSLNEHEGKILFAHMGRDFTWDAPLPSAEADIAFVREQTGLDELIVHTPFFAIAGSASEGTVIVKQRHAVETKITTGAGDNFNGGYISACMRYGALNLRERLFVANAVTGSYVRNGVSPDRGALREEIGKLAAVM